MLKKIVLYSHGGSMNHGCEAIVRSSLKIMSYYKVEKVISKKIEEDIFYGLDELISIDEVDDNIFNSKLRSFFYKLKMKLIKSDSVYYAELYRNITNLIGDCNIAISIGGDNYCYKGFNEELKIINKKLNQKGIKTVLWGCSIEPDLLTTNLIKDLQAYSVIVSRESLTYNALLKSGLYNIKLYPDPAFQLDRKDLPLPDKFVEGNTVGINVSPMIIGYEKNKGSTLANYINLIEYIISSSDMAIALIPHVVWPHNDDREPLQFLYQHFIHTGRVLMIEDCNAMELKGYIARCRYMVAARTHASIAAYSQCIPTLVVGYSVKARGIAIDIFGTDQGYVISVQSLKKEDELTRAFRHIQNNEASIKAHYNLMMNTYIARAGEAGNAIDDL